MARKILIAPDHAAIAANETQTQPYQKIKRRRTLSPAAAIGNTR
jgi:hypothetical protein